MAFFLGLCSIFALLWLVGVLFGVEIFRDYAFIARWAASLMFLFIGVTHLVKPRALIYMIENFLPYAKELIYFSGVLEILFAVGLLFPATQRLSAWGLILLLIAVFPANINVAIQQLPPPGGLPAKPWYVWSRLAFQPVYIAWIGWAALRG
jgi:uncharacterized membrane protein